MTEMRRCPACHQMAMVHMGPVRDWAVDSPPVDAAQYRLWRCTTITSTPQGPKPCATEIKRKDDGKASIDPRYTEPLGIGGDHFK